jgi:citrate lyase subunit beta / citryl-CoA lyase
MTLFRTWMFIPGSDNKKLEKARDLKADVIIYDLEDAVAINEKKMARKLVKNALETNIKKVNYVRVNTVNSSFFYDDVNEIIYKGLAGIVLPKVESREQIQILDSLISELEMKRNMTLGLIEIVPIIESALGLYHSFEIASTSKRVKRIAFGSIDFSLDINAQLTKEGIELLYARSKLVTISRAAGIEAPIDTVFVDIKDQEGLLKETIFVKQLGFQGKLVIHPAQIDVVNEVFKPTIEEIEEAKLIVSGFEEAVSNGSGVVQIRGKMVDFPVVERAKKILQAAETIMHTP